MPLFSPHGFLRTFVNIDSVTEAMCVAVDRPAGSAVFNIGDGEPVGTRKFYRVIADELHSPLRIIVLPVITSRIAEGVAWWAGKLGVHIRIATIVGEFGRNTFVKSERITKELGIVLPDASEEGLRAMVRSACE